MAIDSQKPILISRLNESFSERKNPEKNGTKKRAKLAHILNSPNEKGRLTAPLWVWINQPPVAGAAAAAFGQPAGAYFASAVVSQVQLPSVVRVHTTVEGPALSAAAALFPKEPVMVTVGVRGAGLRTGTPVPAGRVAVPGALLPPLTRRLEPVAPGSHSPVPVPTVVRPSRIQVSIAVFSVPVSSITRATCDFAT